MEEIIKALRNGLSVESLELSLPYLEPFNLLVDYESELEFSSPHSHRHQERRLAQQDPQKKLLTQLRKNPTELEKELRNLVLKLYSAGESEIEGTSEKTTTKSADFADSNLTVVGTPSAILTKDNQVGLNSQQSDLNYSNSSEAWSVGKQDASSPLTFIPPQIDGSKDCKAVTLDCDLNGAVDEAGFRIEQKSANSAHHEDKSLTSDPIQTSKKEKIMLLVEGESNSKASVNKVLDVVQTHADKVHINRKQSNPTEELERSEAFNYALHSGSSETLTTGDHEFDISDLEFRGNKEASVANNLKSRTSLKLNFTGSLHSRGTSTAPLVVPDDSKYHYSQSMLMQAPTSQGVSRGSSFKSPEEVPVTSLESANSKQEVKIGEANLLPTQVGVAQNTSWPGGARQTEQFQEDHLSLSPNKFGK